MSRVATSDKIAQAQLDPVLDGGCDMGLVLSAFREADEEIRRRHARMDLRDLWSDWKLGGQASSRCVI